MKEVKVNVSNEYDVFTAGGALTSFLHKKKSPFADQIVEDLKGLFK